MAKPISPSRRLIQILAIPCDAIAAIRTISSAAVIKKQRKIFLRIVARGENVSKRNQELRKEEESSFFHLRRDEVEKKETKKERGSCFS